MGHTIDLVGRKFNRLLVVSKTSKRDSCGNVLWSCVCDCGNHIDIRTSSLNNSHAGSCGCLSKETNGKRVFKDLTGCEFGLVKVIGFYAYNKNGKSVWLCKCSCGNIKPILGNALTVGATSSCGCLRVSRLARGERHYRWRGGYSDKDYPKEWNRNLKEFIRNRDDRKCQYPNCTYDDTKENKKLSVHHIDGNKDNCSYMNLVSLCNKHHLMVEGNEPRMWESWFYMYTESFCL